MEIQTVHSITATPEPFIYTVDLTADIGRGMERIGFGYHAGDEAPATYEMLAWMMSNPEFPIDPYVEPAPVDPLSQTLTKRQVVRALIIGAAITDPDGFVEAAIATMVDATAKALAFSDWRYAPYFERGHALFSEPEILSATGMSPEVIDGLWALGFEQPK